MAVDNNWTWVLDRPCDQCGYDAASIEPNQLPTRLRVVAGEWRDMLGRGPIIERSPTHPDRTWTILEYGCHVRDVMELLEQRMRLMLKKRKPPKLAMWSPQEAAESYGGADANQVAYDLAANAGKAADVLDRVRGDDWTKQGHRGDGHVFTVDTLARYLLHDAEHHLWDAHQILDE